MSISIGNKVKVVLSVLYISPYYGNPEAIFKQYKLNNQLYYPSITDSAVKDKYRFI